MSFTAEDVQNYVSNHNICYDNEQRVIKEVVEVLNFYDLFLSLNPNNKTLTLHGMIKFKTQTSIFAFPILVDIPSDYPNKLIFIKTGLVSYIPDDFINNDGVINYTQYLSKLPNSMKEIFDLIMKKIQAYSSFPTTPFQPVKKLQIPNVPNVRPPQGIPIPNVPDVPPKQTQFPTIPRVPVKLNVPETTQIPESKPIRQKVKPVRKIEFVKEFKETFDNVGEYLDMIDKKKEYDGWENLYKQGNISKQDFDVYLRDNPKPIDLPPAPAKFQELLEIYKQDGLSRREIICNVPKSSPNDIPKTVVKNKNALDPMQAVFVEMFEDDEITEDEVNILNQFYYEYCKTNYLVD
ncbi:UEV domain-containing protein [Entamoeba marina]